MASDEWLEMIPVTSTAISHVGFDEQTNRLVVRFQAGRSYVYFGVPPRKFNAMLAAASKGLYLDEEIKPFYRCDEVSSLGSVQK